MALPKTFTGGERLFAGDLNDNFEALDTAIGVVQADVDSNKANLNASNLNSGTVPAARFPSGSIVQVVNVQFTEPWVKSSFADSTPVEVPDFKATITPKFNDSKLLVITNAKASVSDSESYNLQMFRTIGSGEEEFNHYNARIVRAQDANYETKWTLVDYNSFYLDSPATTEEVVYQFYFASSGAGLGASINRALVEADRRGESYITIFEVRP